MRLSGGLYILLEKWSTFDENAPLDKDNKKLYWLNVGSGEEISIKNLAEKIANIIGYKGEIKWDTTKPDGTPRKYSIVQDSII